MLPGLFYTSLPHFTVCKTLREMRRDLLLKTLQEYPKYTSDCFDGCKEFHMAAYLFFSYKLRKHLPRELVEGCLISENPKIRLCALRVAIQGLQKANHTKRSGKRSTTARSPALKLLIEKYIGDPFNEIRRLCLRFLRATKTRLSETMVSAAVRHLTDENPNVKIEAVKLLCKSKIRDKRTKADVSEMLCDLIKDKNESVRVASARALKYYVFADLKDLFDKSANGVFVYGLEDECMSVRREAVKSIYFLCSEAAKDEAFDFLVDLLNDDSEEIRILVSRVLKKLSGKFKWTISVEDLNLVILNLQETSRQVTTNLLRFCSNLVYTNETFYFLFIVLDKVSLGKNVNELYRCIHKMALGNHELFYTNHNSIYQISKVQGREPSIHDKNYIGRLLCLDVLRRNRQDMAFPDFFSDHFRFLELKYLQTHNKRAVFVDLQTKLVAALESLAEDPRVFGMYRSLFCKRAAEDTHELFFLYVYRAICHALSRKSMDMLEYVLYRFGLMRTGVSLDVEGLKPLVAGIRYQDVKLITLSIITSSTISVTRDQYIDFKVQILGSTRGYFLKAHDPSRNLSIYYEAAEEVRVFLNEPFLNVLVLCVVARGSRDIRMSPSVSIAIVKT
jgi:hypothetical protein